MGNPYLFLTAPSEGAGIIEGDHVYYPDDDSGNLRMPIKGRGKLKCVAILNTDQTITLRIDDDERPEFWAEIPLTQTFVKLWGAACAAEKMVVVPEGSGKGGDDGNPPV